MNKKKKMMSQSKSNISFLHLMEGDEANEMYFSGLIYKERSLQCIFK
jgi:hypothetical protein